MDWIALALTESISITLPIDSLAVMLKRWNAFFFLSFFLLKYLFSFHQMLRGPSSCWRSCRNPATFPVTSSSPWRKSFRVNSAQQSERWVSAAPAGRNKCKGHVFEESNITLDVNSTLTSVSDKVCSVLLSCFGPWTQHRENSSEKLLAQKRKEKHYSTASKICTFFLVS